MLAIRRINSISLVLSDESAKILAVKLTRRKVLSALWVTLHVAAHLISRDLSKSLSEIKGSPGIIMFLGRSLTISRPGNEIHSLTISAVISTKTKNLLQSK